jgi:hypothetical protein
MFLDIAYCKFNSTSVDCCDGSDEWDIVVECLNVCSELGQKAREVAQKYRASLEVGFKQRRKS